jgi:hypothetical protein
MRCRRFCLIAWSIFVERGGVGAGHQLTEEVGGVPIPAFDHLGVDAQGGRGICAAEAAGDGAYIAPGGDECRGAEVPQGLK